MIEISAALASAGQILGIAKAGLDARDDAKVKAALTELQMKLFEATSAALAMAEKSAALQTALSEAQREKAELERKAEDRAMYRLHKLGAGAFAYASQPALDGNGPPQHYLCQPCYDKGVKTVLRLVQNSWGGADWECAAEKAHHFSAERGQL